MKLLSTRARAELWRRQAAVRTTSRERERLLRMLTSSRVALTGAAQRDAVMEFVCADQEYRHTVVALEAFVREHNARVEASNDESDATEPLAPLD